MHKPISFKIDTIIGNTYEIPKNIRKGDTLAMTISMFQDSLSLNLTGQTIHIIIRKPDGYSVDMRSETAMGYLTVSNNQIVAIFKDKYIATSAAGIATGEIHLIDTNGEDITNWFVFEVGESLADDIVIKSEDKIDTLLEIENTIANYNLNADILAEQNNLAIQNKAELQALNTNANSLAVRLENDIVNGIEVAERLENDILTGNSLDITLKDDIKNGSTIHDNLQIAITDGNEVILQLQNNANWPMIQQIFDLVNKMSVGTLDDENGDPWVDENGEQFIG